MLQVSQPPEPPDNVTPPPRPPELQPRSVVATCAHTPARWIVIDKPSGMLSVPGKGPDRTWSAAAWARQHFPHATGPITVHRLDMDTSGLLLMGLDAAAQRQLSLQFEARTVAKVYEALVDGHMGQDSGVVDLPMRPDPTNRPWQVIDPSFGRPSLTRYTVLLRTEQHEGPAVRRITRVRLQPQTGRTHQLRLHMASLGHAILGDVLYAPPGVRAASEVLCLHATELAFDDVSEGHRVEVCSQPEW